jgi:pentatricopeptide repeat protein
MLSSTRASALAYNLAHRALPAESSRQGLLRAIAQQRAAAIVQNGQKRTIHRRDGSTYATAVAYEENERVDHEEYEDWRIAARERNRRFPEPRPPDTVMSELAADRTGVAELEVVEEDLPSLDGLRTMMRTEAVRALHLFPRYSASELSKFSARDLNEFLKSIHRQSQSYPPGRHLDLVGKRFEKSLEVLRGLLYHLPTTAKSNDRNLGKRFKRDLLGRFLRICIILDSESILRSTLKERLEAQRIDGEVLVKPELWATELVNRQKYTLLIDLLSPSSFPIASMTPGTIFRLMQAHIGVGNIAKVVSLFELFDKLAFEPPPRAYSLLIQAHLVLGDLDTARQVMQKSLSRNKADDVARQLAILKGYRELGRDVAMEERVLEASKGMQNRDQAAMLHALIRLRLDGDDASGARELLKRFDCDYWVGLAGDKGYQGQEKKLPANAETHILGFRMMAPYMTMESLEKSWEYLQSKSVPITDQIMRVLFTSLVRLGHIEEARNVVSGKAASMPLPDTYKPGPLILNTLLEHSGKSEGWKGFGKTLKSFRSMGIKPDDRTLSVVLGYIRDNVTKDPTTLANLTNSLLRESSGTRPTVDHMDLLLGQAVRAHARSAELAVSSKSTAGKTFDISDPSSTSPQAGLNTRDPFSNAVRSIIQSLRSRGVRSMSRSLATRLRFDAQSHSSMTTAPSVRAVWDDLIARGYKPDKKHFLALMKGYADSGHMDECEDVVLLAKDMGVEPTRGMWMVLMSSYGAVRRPWFNLTKAEKAFQAIQESEQGLDLPAVCAMIGIYYRGGHRQAAADLALRLVGDIVNPSGTETLDIDTPRRTSSWSIPNFKPSEFTDRSLAITTQALRLDHAILALQVISTTYSTSLPTRVRDVVKSIRNRARARVTRGIAMPVDYEVLRLGNEILASPLGRGGGQKIGPEGVKRKVLRLFSGRTRGSGGRKVISMRDERRVRYRQKTLGRRSAKSDEVTQSGSTGVLSDTSA